VGHRAGNEGKRDGETTMGARKAGIMLRGSRWWWTLLVVATAGIAPSGVAMAAPPSPGLRIVYRTVFNGQEAPDEGRIVVDINGGVASVCNEPAGAWRTGAPHETAYLDYDAGKTWQMALLKDGSQCTVETAFPSLTPLVATGETASVLGRPCRKSTCVMRSNQIEVWHTEGGVERGSPLLNIVAPEGLVLRIVRNGNYEIVARTIEQINGSSVHLPAVWGDLVDQSEYQARLTESWITTVPVFEREVINFGGDIPAALPDDPAGARSPVYHHASGTVILRRVHLPEDLDDATIMAELVQYSCGDAYDRTGSVFVVPAAREGDTVTFLDALRHGIEVLPTFQGRDGRTYQGMMATDSYQPPIELIRFITPYGVRQYNKQVKVRGLAWEDSVTYHVDVTDLGSVLHGNTWIGAFIGNYDKGGHVFSLTLRYHPNRREAEAAADAAPRHFALPLFNTCNVMEMAGQEYGRFFATDSLTVSFDVPAGAHDCTLRYVTTGHGGWGNGDEFVPKVNEVLIDGQTAARFVPWRTDCGAYRRFSPATGSYWNGMSSSDYSRSGWCPGAAVSPLLVPLPDITPGRHTLRVTIPQGAPEGSSFSSWKVSGVLTGER
jgi:hypothetical protein